MTAFPDRVLVHGVTGSGKSTAALAIGVPPVLLLRRPGELETWLESLEHIIE